MKKILILAAIVATMAGCSTAPIIDQPTEATDAGVKYTQEFGHVEVTFTTKGWESLTSTGTSAVPVNDNLAFEQAMNVATMRAKRNIIEFIQTDLQSSKATEAFTNAMAKDTHGDLTKTKERSGDIATSIQEKIAVEAKGIVRGSYVIERKVSDDGTMAVVTIKVDHRSMKAADMILGAFDG